MTTSTSPQIEFIQFHHPALISGDYVIQVQQAIASQGNDKIPAETYEAAQPFSVLGARFSIKPEDIQAVFPPANSLGEHSNVLPHLILKRSTLPWERLTEPTNEDLPWLALLLFDEDESVTPQIITVKDLKNGGQAKFPKVINQGSRPPSEGAYLELEMEQHADDKLTVIDVPKKLLARILPQPADLQFLAHVRQATDEHGQPVGDEMAVLIGNRLPQAGKTSTVHLVSLENRYNAQGFDFQGAGEADLIRLVSLKNWQFACVDEKQSFKGLLTHLNRSPSTFRLPQNDQPEAEIYLAEGHLPLRHHFREGSQSVSWYHGPLIPGDNTETMTLPSQMADELVRYEPSIGMFDVSYAAAWELGRLLTLQSKRVSLALYHWKRTHAQQLKQLEQAVIHLPIGPQDTNIDAPASVISWFQDLEILKGIPFNYLVPDEQLLPPESLRFFQVDHLWLDCLADGAFSVGRVNASDHENQPDKPSTQGAQVTGFLLRSEVVSGWPDLLVDGYDEVVVGTDFEADQDKLPLLRMERLSATVLICLFAGEVQTIDLHQKPEALHFGLNRPDDSNATYYKFLRDSQGVETMTKVSLTDASWQDVDKQVLNINRLATEMQTQQALTSFTSAQFALQMIEGVQKVRFAMRDE